MIWRNKPSEISTQISSLRGRLTNPSLPVTLTHLVVCKWLWTIYGSGWKWNDPPNDWTCNDNVMMEMLFLFCRDWWILDDSQTPICVSRANGWRLFYSHLPPAVSQLAISKPQHFTTSCEGLFRMASMTAIQLYDKHIILYITWKNANPKSEHASSRHWCLAAHIDCNGTSRTRCFPQVGCPLPVALRRCHIEVILQNCA